MVMAHIAGLFGREVEAMRWRTKVDITAFDRFPRPSQPKTHEFLNGMAIPRHEESFLLVRAWGIVQMSLESIWNEAPHRI